MAPIPDDLAELERLLAERTGPEPPPRLRARVLAAVRLELDNRPVGFLGWHSWRLAAAAAGVLVVLNLTLSWANHGATLNKPGPEVALVPRWDNGKPPGWTEDEIRTRRLLAQAGAQLTPGPDIRPLCDRLFSIKEVELWDMH